MASSSTGHIDPHLADPALGELGNDQPFVFLDLDSSLPNPGLEAIAARRRLLLRYLIAIGQDDIRAYITTQRLNIAYEALAFHYDEVGEHAQRFRQRQMWNLNHVGRPTFARPFSLYIQRMGWIQRRSVACILLSNYDMSLASNDKPAGLI